MEGIVGSDSKQRAGGYLLEVEEKPVHDDCGASAATDSGYQLHLGRDGDYER